MPEHATITPITTPLAVPVSPEGRKLIAVVREILYRPRTQIPHPGEQPDEIELALLVALDAYVRGPKPGVVDADACARCGGPDATEDLQLRAWADQYRIRLDYPGARFCRRCALLTARDAKIAFGGRGS